MGWFIESAICLVYLFKCRSKAYCNCAYLLEFWPYWSSKSQSSVFLICRCTGVFDPSQLGPIWGIILAIFCCLKPWIAAITYHFLSIAGVFTCPPNLEDMTVILILFWPFSVLSRAQFHSPKSYQIITFFPAVDSSSLDRTKRAGFFDSRALCQSASLINSIGLH